jgi:pyruvate formate lyase activating enzyme
MKAKLWKKEKDKIRCQLCNHRCLIDNEGRGLCGVRKNKNGVLISLNYSRLIAENIDTIEKKPIYHYLPNSLTYSIATPGCNFSCMWCQNSEISQITKDKTFPFSKIIKRSPKQIASSAKKNNCQSIAYTYTEPTIFFEFALETMKIAKKNNLRNIWVSNGYFTKKCWQQIKDYLDAINIDLKGFKEETYQKFCSAKLEPVLSNIYEINQSTTHLEITTLIIPNINDSKKELTDLAKYIYSLNPEIPWHLSRFYPKYKILDKEKTSRSILEKAKAIGKNIGLKYIYLGNL